MVKIKQRAQVFFILIIVLFLIVIAVAVIFGGILASETIVQKTKIESVKTDGLTLSALNNAIYLLRQNPILQLTTTTLTLSQGTSTYSIRRLNPTTTEIKIGANVGKIIKNSKALVVLSASSTTSTITKIQFNYDK
jgi:hypothetical protein